MYFHLFPHFFSPQLNKSERGLSAQAFVFKYFNILNNLYTSTIFFSFWTSFTIKNIIMRLQKETLIIIAFGKLFQRSSIKIDIKTNDEKLLDDTFSEVKLNFWNVHLRMKFNYNFLWLFYGHTGKKGWNCNTNWNSTRWKDIKRLNVSTTTDSNSSRKCFRSMWRGRKGKLFDLEKGIWISKTLSLLSETIFSVTLWHFMGYINRGERMPSSSINYVATYSFIPKEN